MTGPTTIDELRALQLERLRETLRAVYAAGAALHRVRFGQAGVHPDELQSLADLARFPFTAKADLRENYPFGIFAVPREEVAPDPRLVGHHRQADRRRLYARRHRHLGGAHGALDPRRREDGAGDVVHVAYGYGLFTGGLGAHYGAERLGCTVVPVSAG